MWKDIIKENHGRQVPCETDALCWMKTDSILLMIKVTFKMLSHLTFQLSTNTWKLKPDQVGIK